MTVIGIFAENLNQYGDYRPRPRGRSGQAPGAHLIRLIRLHLPAARLRFWRDPDGPEVDWVLEHHGAFLPIEVKLSDRPSARDARHVRVFIDEHNAAAGLVVCTAPRKLRLGPKVTAVPWQELPDTVLRAARSMA